MTTRPDLSATGAYAGFDGEIGETMGASVPSWPPLPVAPKGAPNVVVVLCDDLGFADLGCYGSEIATHEIDRMAAEGLRYTNFHVTPMCSPTRASLLTGLNSHLAGVGHVAHSDCGFPGYATALANDTVTLAEILRDNGYATMMVGKWHLAKDSDLSPAGSQESWPCQRGFDRFYGFLDAFTNLHQPHRLVQDNTVVEVDRYPDDYYFTDDITDRAIAMVRDQQASNPAQPFFLYFAHGAVHAPMQAKRADIERQRGRYDDGWDALRERRWQRQQELGLLGDHAELAPKESARSQTVVPWEKLDADRRRLYARFMEIYAAMVETIDESLGRLRRSLEQLGVWDNTVVMFLSDNGAAREGETHGTSQFFAPLVYDPDIRRKDLERLELLGGPRTLPHYQRGWAYACNTPFRLYKASTHAGGHQVPLVLRGPSVPATGEIRRQYQHVTDILPTLLDVIGIDAPPNPVKPLAGASFRPTFADDTAPSSHPEQVYEISGHRGYYRQGWEVVTRHEPMADFADDHWELYDLHADPTETDDLAAEHPDRVAELVDAWDHAAWANQIYPLDEGGFGRFFVRPPSAAAYHQPVRIVPGTPTLERWRCLQLIQMRDFTIRIELAYRTGDQGMLVAHGDQGGGYAIYIEDGRLVWAHNGYGAMTLVDGGQMADGAEVIEARVTALEGGRWRVELAVDGVVVGGGEDLLHFWFMAPLEGIDVGIDRRSPVSWDIYERHGPFPYTGHLTAVTYTPGDPAPDAPVPLVETILEARRRYD
ncbi:arylsulfatase [Candidatus Poriferisocius sp.]|uniref:arylsulfatase n=1 Tax=Candidatus Poriferisocius sp. TaxID=3101276 RepID=UPI003B5BE418